MVKPPISPFYPDWQPQYEALITETHPSALRWRATDLETAIFHRLQEIAGRTDCEEERAAIQAAMEKVREIQREKLGFPPIKPLTHRAGGA